MAKQAKPDPVAAVPDDEQVVSTCQVYSSMLDKLRVIRDRRKLTGPQTLEKYAGPAIDREYRKVVEEMAAEFDSAE